MYNKKNEGNPKMTLTSYKNTGNVMYSTCDPLIRCDFIFQYL